jgi:exonuclease V gamma subunit
MKNIIYYFLLATAVFAQSGCAAWQQNKWLSAHRQNLQKLASSNLNPEQKLDGLIQNYIVFMNEGLRFVNPVKGAKYVKKYHDQNSATIEKILKEAEGWKNGLNTIDAVAAGVRTARKPYIKEVIDLAPKFKKKYEQYTFIANLTGKIAGSLGKIAGKALF